MEKTNTKQNEESRTEVVCDVPRSENEVYRIARKEYKGRHFVDLRIFFRAKEDRDRLIPTHKGICLDETLREELIVGLIAARKATATKSEDSKVQSVVVCEIPVSENEVCRISKGSGSKNSFVDIRRFFKKNGGYVPYKQKGVSITESVLDAVITGLMTPESSCAA